jgi:glycosyltransferase involved in cell wall biosynthesis
VISVIIPTCNRRVLLAQALRSVLEQTLVPEEIIVADDGSTDGTGDLIAAFSTENPALRFLPLEHRGFPGRGRNAGARIARGRFLAFLDSDDLWESQKLEKQRAFFTAHPALKVCHTRERWLRKGREVSQARSWGDSGRTWRSPRTMSSGCASAPASRWATSTRR